VSVTGVGQTWAYRALVWNFARRELKAKFKGSVLGWVWSLLNPLATLVIFTIVFSTIFRAEPPPLGNGDAGIYAVFLFSGLVCWNLFNNTVQQGMLGLVGAGPLLKKIYFPAYTPVMGVAVAVAVQSAIEGGLLLLVMLVLGNVSWTWLLAPVVLLLLAIFSYGWALLFSILNVRYRDVSYLVGIGLQLVFYATPIIYPISLIPAEAFGLPLRDLLALNPLAQFVQAFRDCVYSLTVPSPGLWLSMLAWSLGSLLLGFVVFQRGARDVSEEL
jgi:ABC-type polysaccharide/polyol phosphate export permease